MKFVIWGTGTRGKALFRLLGEDKVCAFIDSNADIQGTNLFGKLIVSYEEYKAQYADFFIIISMMHYHAVAQQLQEDGVYHFFALLESPGECYGFGDNNFLKHLPYKMDNKLPNVIWGINLFSILLMEVMQDKGIKEVYLVPHDGMTTERREAVRRFFPANYVDTLPEEYKAYIYMAVESDRKKIGHSDNLIYNAFDFSHQLPSYYNPQIASLKKKYDGERCFIVATGPSLKMADLDKLYENHEYSFSMNKIFHAFEKTMWRPDFYLAEDRRVIQQNLESINRLKIQYMFLGDVSEFQFRKDIQRYHAAARDYEKKGQKFSEDISWGVYIGGTVTYSCIQFAVYMGFREIFLLGVDFTYGKPGSQGNHFYQQEDEINASFLQEECLEAYETAKQYAEEHGIKIYNATRGGALEVFERVDFDSLFE